MLDLNILANACATSAYSACATLVAVVGVACWTLAVLLSVLRK